MSLRTRKRRTLAIDAAVLCLFGAFAIGSNAQTPTPLPAASAATCAAPAPCPTTAPLIIKLSVFYKEGAQPWEKSDTVRQLSRKPFFISSCPFDLEKLPNIGRAPSRKSYYTSVKASAQLIKWLESNNCDTIYCRELRREEVTCKSTEPNCVPEFVTAYEEAQRKLKGSPELARRWVTNYAPLNSRELVTGFYKKKKEWLDAAVAIIEKAANLATGSIKSAMTDREGVAYFYDLCPTSYYISSIAPVETKEGESITWETLAIKLKQQDVSTVTAISLANVEPKDAKKKGKSYFVGRKVVESASAARAGARDSTGQ